MGFTYLFNGLVYTQKLPRTPCRAEIWKRASAEAQTKEPWQILGGLQSRTTDRGFLTLSEDCPSLQAAVSSCKSRWGFGRCSFASIKTILTCVWTWGSKRTRSQHRGSGQGSYYHLRSLFQLNGAAHHVRVNAVSMGNSRRFSPPHGRGPFRGAWDHSPISSRVPIFTKTESTPRLSPATKSKGGGGEEKFN